jgi:hypothetical protein
MCERLLGAESTAHSYDFTHRFPLLRVEQIDDARFLGRNARGNVAVNAHGRLAGLASSLARLRDR